MKTAIKKLILVISCILLLLNMMGCGQRNKSKILEQYKNESKSDTNEQIKRKLDSWVKEGAICYGIVMVRDGNGLPKRLREVKAKISSIQSDKIKMEALEEINMAQIKGCIKVSIKEGENWDETDGELFKTREQAIQYIDANFPGLRLKY